MTISKEQGRHLHPTYVEAKDATDTEIGYTVNHWHCQDCGKNCILAGQVGIVGHVKIADNTTIGAKSGIIGNVRKSGSVLFGIPALDRVQYLKAFAKFKASAED